MRADNLLIIADSERDADMLYAVGMFVPDPFIFLRLRGEKIVVLNDLEIDRGRKQASGCKVLSLSRYVQRLQREGAKKINMARVVQEILSERRIKKILVSERFPLALARDLRKFKVKVRPKDGALFPERESKNADEVKKISAALMMAEVGLAEAIQALKVSKIGKARKLMYHGVPLTSEKLRSIIDVAVIQAGGLPANTIVAGGEQACDPHERGHGVLRANEPIIIDIFPRSQKTGYYGDITRTVVKGKASEAVRKLYHTVAQGQQLAFDKMHASVTGGEVHQVVADYFAAQGYKTQKRNGRFEGFFHGTGHGLGLEIHEAPRTGQGSENVLRCGHVVTVEPGLYYPGIGGVRLEDVALVNHQAPRNLTKFEKVLEV